MHHPRANPAARTAAILVTLALVIGLPQFLVLCTPAGGAPHVERSCSSECCQHHGDRSGSGHAHDGLGWHWHGADEDQDPLPDNGHCHGCVHAALGTDLAPTPRSGAQVIVAAAIATRAPPTLAVPPRLEREIDRVWAPPTGPPRPRPILQRIASTVLRQ